MEGVRQGIASVGNGEGNKKTNVVEVPGSRRVISEGTREGKVYSAEVGIGGDAPTRMVIKEYHTMNEVWSKEVKRMVNLHGFLKSCGVPTLDTFMQVEDEPNKVYMSDETKNGTVEVFSLTDFWGGIGDSANGRLFDPTVKPDPNAKRGEKDKHFYRRLFTFSNPDEIQQQVADLMDKCVRNGVSVEHEDVFFIEVEKATNKAKVILGDLGFASRGTPAEAVAITTTMVKSLFERLPLVANIIGILSKEKLVQTETKLKQEFGG